jgi:hypothetical protein
MLSQAVRRAQAAHEFPNRQVGDLSRQPTTGRAPVISAIPQPAGWGSFTLAYEPDRRAPSMESPDRQVGDLSLLPASSTGERALCRLTWKPSPTSRILALTP